MILTLVALGFSLATIATLYQCWRTHSPRLMYSAVAGFVLCCLTWSHSQGWEYGMVYALCLPGLLVWPFIGFNQVRLAAPNNRPATRRVSLSAKLAAIHIGNTLVVLVGLMLTSVLASLALSLRLPFEQSGQLAFCLVVLPVLWGGLAYHYLATCAKGKALLGYGALSALSLLMLIYLPGLE